MEVSTSLNVPTGQFVICLILPECLAAKIFSISGLFFFFGGGGGVFRSSKIQSQRKSRQIFISWFTNTAMFSLTFCWSFPPFSNAKYWSHWHRNFFFETFICWHEQYAQWKYELDTLEQLNLFTYSYIGYTCNK